MGTISCQNLFLECNPRGKTFIGNIKNWKPEELVFNAVAWNEGYRFFGCSRDLSKIMSRLKKENSEFIWLVRH